MARCSAGTAFSHIFLFNCFLFNILNTVTAPCVGCRFVVCRVWWLSCARWAGGVALLCLRRNGGAHFLCDLFVIPCRGYKIAPLTVLFRLPALNGPQHGLPPPPPPPPHHHHPHYRFSSKTIILDLGGLSNIIVLGLIL